MIDIVDKALTFASEKHKDQTYSGGPFIDHPQQTAAILYGLLTIKSEIDDNLIAAALLHDTLEDTDTTYEELVTEFNQDVADLVKEVTDQGWNIFPNLKSQRGIMLKFADRLANISNMHKWDFVRQQKYIRKSKFWKDKEHID